MYSLIKRLAEGLVGVGSRQYGTQLWVAAKARKPAKCAVCHRTIQKGEQAFRPLGNAQNRMHRICQHHFEQKTS